MRLLPVLIAIGIAVAELIVPSTALAWLELRVSSDVATITVDESGSARVRHEMLLKVRGGPLKRFTIQGVDIDAEPVAGASIVRARSGQAAGIPITLLMSRDEDLLDLELTYKKGVRTGTYLVAFEYDTRLEAQAPASTNDRVTLVWQGPRFDDGIDSLRARFILPRYDPPPRISASESERDGDLGVVATENGVFLSELRREAERDVLELTRPHAARGERVAWQVQVASKALKAPAIATQPVASEASPHSLRAPPTSAPLWPWFVGAATGLLLSLLVECKHRFLKRQRGDNTEPASTFLLPLPSWLRLVMIVSAVCATIGLALQHEQATAAAACACAAILLSLQRPTAARPHARGPGQWEELDPDGVLSDALELRGWGRLLEGTTLSGLAIFTTLLAAIVVFALRHVGVAPYRAVTLIALSTLLVPVFFTLGGARLCLPRMELDRRVVCALHTALRKRKLKATLVGRVAWPSSGAPPATDEIRIRIELDRPRAGLESLELALETTHGGWFAVSQPVFIVRVRDGSDAHQALPRGASWCRGRYRDERIALLRLTLPTKDACADTARALAERLTRQRQVRKSSSKASRSRGKAALASNAATVAPPP